MADKPVTRNTLIAVTVLVLAVMSTLVYAYSQGFWAGGGGAALKYTTGLTGGIRASDQTLGSALTSNIALKLYDASATPFTRVFTDSYLKTATYSATTATLGAAWTFTGVDAGSYMLLAQDTTSPTKTKYPEAITVSITGTDKSELECWFSPSEVAMVQRATTAITKAGLAYNVTAGSYSITASTIDTTAYDKWLFTFTFTISGTDKVVKIPRVYMSKISGLTPTEYSLDGAIKQAVNDDTEASDDGLTGYYVEVSVNWKGGEIHRLDMYFDDYGGTATGTETIKLYEYYACHNTNLRWWTDPTSTVTVST
jgi:hypothetical protein